MMMEYTAFDEQQQQQQSLWNSNNGVGGSNSPERQRQRDPDATTLSFYQFFGSDPMRTCGVLWRIWICISTTCIPISIIAL